MIAGFVPVTEGSSESRWFEADGLRILKVWFPPGSRIPAHRHDRANFAVMIDGSFDVARARESHSCPPSTVFTEPLGERHANRVDRRGARVVVLQPDPGRAGLIEPCAPLFQAHRHFLDGRIGDLARRLAQELDRDDSVSRVAAEGLALEMLATAARIAETECRKPRPPGWLARAQDLLHEHFLEDLRVTEVARAVGVHPVYFARVFRAHLRVPIGAYVRGLRLEWAARRLAHGEEPLSEIALAAGFADQSHFTRVFRRYAGATPLRYRRGARG